MSDALSAGIGGLLGAGSSALSSVMNYAYSKKLMDYQYKINQKSLLNSPLQSRKGYVKAGYNPLLALGSPGMGFSANSSGFGSDLSSGLNSGVNSALAVRQNKATIDNIRADTGLKNQQGETEKARRVQMEFQNAMTDVETHLKRKDLSTYDRKFYSDLYEQMQRAENYRANSAVSLMNAETNRMNARTNRLNYQVNSANSATNAYNAVTSRYKRTSSGFGFSSTSYEDPRFSSDSWYHRTPIDDHAMRLNAYGYR